MKRRMTVSFAMAIVLIAGGLAVNQPVMAGPQGVAGSYIALLDLGGLGAPRIETLYVVLDQNRSAIFTSEHEADKESAGIGRWRRLPGGKISLGIASFRYGPTADTSICGTVGVDSPPGNCVLKVGGMLDRGDGGSLTGDLFLTVETLDGTTSFAFPGDPPLPIVMYRLTLEDFPGALP